MHIVSAMLIGNRVYVKVLALMGITHGSTLRCRVAIWQRNRLVIASVVLLIASNIAFIVNALVKVSCVVIGTIPSIQHVTFQLAPLIFRAATTSVCGARFNIHWNPEYEVLGVSFFIELVLIGLLFFGLGRWGYAKEGGTWRLVFNQVCFPACGCQMILKHYFWSNNHIRDSFRYQ